jgi:hypothetical protein
MNSSTRDELADIKIRFDSYATVHGDLFEDAVIPLTEEDMKDAVDRRKRFSKRFWIIYGIGMVGVAAGLTIGKTPRGGDYFYIISLIGFPLIYRMMIMTAFDNAIKNKEKRVIHGVITRKEIKRFCHVEFSGKLTIGISNQDYKVLKLGDIVRMEMLAKDTAMRRKIVVEGRI